MLQVAFASRAPKNALGPLAAYTSLLLSVSVEFFAIVDLTGDKVGL